MCRSKADGGRRCSGRATAVAPGSRPVRPAASPSTAGAARAEARARYLQAERALSEAKGALGPSIGNPSYLLLSPLARQAELGRAGGDPSVYDDQVAQGRGMLISLLVSHGDGPDGAAAKADALAVAYATWHATPED